MDSQVPFVPERSARVTTSRRTAPTAATNDTTDAADAQPPTKTARTARTSKKAKDAALAAAAEAAAAAKDDDVDGVDREFAKDIQRTASARDLSRRVPFTEARTFEPLQQFIQRLDLNMWDLDAWLALVATAAASSPNVIPVPIVRDIFDNAAVQFPSVSKIWVSWVMYEQKVHATGRTYAMEERAARPRGGASAAHGSLQARKKRTLADLEAENDVPKARSRGGKKGSMKDTDNSIQAIGLTGSTRAADTLLSDDEFEDPGQVIYRRLEERDVYDQKMRAEELAKQQNKDNNSGDGSGAGDKKDDNAEKIQPPKPFDYIVLKIFNRALRCCMSIELAQLYVSYINARFPLRQDDGTTIVANRSTIIQAFEFVLQFLGTDVNSGPIWAAYIKFVKNAFNESEQQQRMELLRKVYHRVIWTPVNNIEQLWQDYDSFENGLNRITAKKFIADKSSGYMTARASLREVTSYLELINRLSRVWVARAPTWNERELIALREWKKYIQYEMSNPLGYEDEALVHARVAYAFRSALAMLRYFPEIWHMYSQYCVNIGRPRQAIQILQSATRCLPTSMIISFTLAEVYEMQKKPVSEIYSIFDTLLINLAKEKRDINLKYDYWLNRMLTMYEATFKAKANVKSENEMEEDDNNNKNSVDPEIISALREESLELPLFADAQLNTLMLQLDKSMSAWASKFGDDDDEEEWDGERRERERERKRQFHIQIESVIEERRSKELEVNRNCIGLVWVVYIRTARRVKDVTSARQIFKIARQRDEKFGGECPSQVWVCAALMEHHINKDPQVAARIFEFALKTFDLRTDPQAQSLVLQYLDFLLSLNNDTNTRALFERTLAILPSKNAHLVWDRFLNYEHQYGDLQSFLNVEKRMRALYTQEAEEKKSLMASRVGKNTVGGAEKAVDSSLLNIYSDKQDMSVLKEIAGRWDNSNEYVIADRELGISKKELFVAQFTEEHDKLMKSKKGRSKAGNSSRLPQFGLYDVAINTVISSASQPTSAIDENLTGFGIYVSLVEGSPNGFTLHSFTNKNGAIQLASSNEAQRNEEQATPTAVVIPEDPASYNPKKLQSLASVTPDRFPRPDFRRWVSYKPEAPSFQSGMESGIGGMTPVDAVMQTLAKNSSFARVLDAIGPVHAYQGAHIDPQTVLSLLQSVPLRGPSFK